jgi:hypothetical protein
MRTQKGGDKSGFFKKLFKYGIVYEISVADPRYRMGKIRIQDRENPDPG